MADPAIIVARLRQNFITKFARRVKNGAGLSTGQDKRKGSANAPFGKIGLRQADKLS